MQDNAGIASPRVLIVGAGPVGLSIAIELGHRGVPCLLVEKNDRVGYAPRAKTTNVRTRGHLRRWGIADRLRAASPLGVDYPSNVVFVTRLDGHELTRFENAFYCAPGRNPLYSEHAQWVPQYTLEEVLREHVETLASVQVRFNCEMLGFEQADGRVQASLRDLKTGSDGRVEVDFLVGADGARSAVRQGIGAKMQGTYGLSRNFNIVFRAPGLARAHKHGPAIMYWQVNADVPSLIGPMDSGDKWFFMPTKVSDALAAEPLDACALIRKATGIDLDYEILSTDEWTASELIADRYRDRRVFLAGDACHLHPPFGGYGMNMGVADAVDLGWKLAAVLQGWGGGRLLDSYEAERRPVHELVLEEAVLNHATLGNQWVHEAMDDEGDEGRRIRAEAGARIQAAKLREFSTLGVVLGCAYGASPVIEAEQGAPRALDFINYVPSARPGCLAPHAWLHDGTSLYDHFGRGFTLLALPGADPSGVALAQEHAAAHGLPLTVVRRNEPALPRLYGAAFTLIRPDQHVAWRGNAWPATGADLMARVMGLGVTA